MKAHDPKPKPLDLPPALAHALSKDVAAYFVESDPIKRREIALRQLHALRGYQRSNSRPLQLRNVKALFMEMKANLD